MRRTDDFLADLDAQLAAAAAGALPRRRGRSPRVLLRPVLVTAIAAASALAFVLAAGGGGEPERAAQPPQSPPFAAEPFALQMGHPGPCRADVGDAEIPDLSVLRRPATRTAGDGSLKGRDARADMPVVIVPMADVSSCVFDGSSGPGACALVELGDRRSACWSLADIQAGRAAAGLGEGFLIAVLPDSVREVTFVIGSERDTYRVTDNVVIANLEGAKKGATIQMLVGATAAPGVCGEGEVLDSPLPSELQVAVPVLVERPAMDAPDHVMDALTDAGANRIWPGEARWLQTAGTASVWVVPVADSRFAECGDPLVSAPRFFEGPGVCAVVQPQTEDGVKAVVCRDLDELGDVIAPEVDGGRLVVAFMPHGALSLETNGKRLHETTPPSGLVAGVVPAERGTPRPVFVDADGPVDPEDLATARVDVLAARSQQAEAILRRLMAAGIESTGSASHPGADRSRVLYASGMASRARQVAELLRVQDVVPLDAQTQALAGIAADVVVVAGEDLRP